MDKLQEMYSGNWYLSGDDELLSIQRQCLELMDEFNMTKHSEREKRKQLCKAMMGSFGEGSYIETPFYANWGGKHIFFGKNCYVNFHLTCVDDAPIYIGDYTMIGPNCTLAVAKHPLDYNMRMQGYQANEEIHIGKNVWLGANVVVLPGVTIGDHAVIGAGSVVTKDIPAKAIAYGNPCRVKEILE